MDTTLILLNKSVFGAECHGICIPLPWGEYATETCRRELIRHDISGGFLVY